jgi:hypothetical protein
MNLMWVCGAEIANLAAVIGMLLAKPSGRITDGANATDGSRTQPPPSMTRPPAASSVPLPGCIGRSAAAGEPDPSAMAKLTERGGPAGIVGLVPASFGEPRRSFVQSKGSLICRRL